MPVDGVDGENGSARLKARDLANPEAQQKSSGDLDARDVDAYWLQRQVRKVREDADKVAEEALEILANLKLDQRECEDQLVTLMDYNHFELVKLMLQNRFKIAYATKLKRADNAAELDALKSLMRQDARLQPVLDELDGKEISSVQPAQAGDAVNDDDAMDVDDGQPQEARLPYAVENRASRNLDLDTLAFQQGAHFMSNKKVSLPKGSFRVEKKGYEEIAIPAVVHPRSEADVLVPIVDMPEWAQAGFSGMKSLNRVQSKLYSCAFQSNENFLLCAPTGAGKTNVAMLAIMHEIGKHVDPQTGEVDREAFKIVYVAPMKSLVQEMVLNFSERLKHYKIQVRELSGDVNLTKRQISETQVLVTTPEKWDIITRKSGDAKSYTQLVKLVCIDEIHLLHDDRGPVLENLVARTIRQIESSQEMVRIIGLSATLPNYEDVATFLRVKEQNVFAFPNSYRPVPLEQTYIGISVKKPFKRFQLMNQICYEKVMAQMPEQVLVFVHSRKETAKTARTLRDMALEAGDITKIMPQSEGVQEILRTQAEVAYNADLKEMLPYGIGIHHAGMKREDRQTVEDLFFGGHLRMIVSTATLAWGVNLPAHAVVIKGTQIYNPEKGRWCELSPLDVMQMLGRAGRPQFDDRGYGCVITTAQELQFYLSLMNQQLPIESQFIKKLPDSLNAEIVLGTIQNVKDAVNWLGYTYLYVCMLRNPSLYGISASEAENDRVLEQRRYDLIHSAATVLSKHNLIKYDRKGGHFQVTDLGKIASHYYVSYKSMSAYNEHLKPTSTDIDLIRVFTLSAEFSQIAVRTDERLELEKLLERVPIPVKESIEEPSAKINVLLQAYISKLKLEGFSLVSDMVYVTQSAGRIMRALFEIALRRGWAQLAERCLSFCMMIEKRMWSTQSPLRQFGRAVPEEVIKKLEKKDFTMERLYDLNAQELGELVRYPTLGKQIFRAVHQFPKLDLTASVQPVTRSLLRVELQIDSDFEWNDDFHGTAQPFWILVQDTNAETILHSELFVLKKQYANETHFVSFSVPMFDPMPPMYFIKVISDRWIGSEATLPVSFHRLILPAPNPRETELLDLQPLPVAALKNRSFESIYAGQGEEPAWSHFNPIQTQTFNTLYNTDQNTLICAPTGTGKTVCAEFAMFRELSKESAGKIVYVAPFKSLLDERERDWKKRIGSKLGLQIVQLNGDADEKKLAAAHVILATPERWDQLSRRGTTRVKSLLQVKLFIVDEMHLIANADVGHILEVCTTRMRFMSMQLKKASKNEESSNPIRIVALSTSLLNAKDLGDWIGATSHSLFNFHPDTRPVELKIVMQGFDAPQFSSRQAAMVRPLLYAVQHHAEEKPVVVFVPSRKLARSVALDLIVQARAEGRKKRFLHIPEEDLAPFLERIESRALRDSLAEGVAYYHEAMSDDERRIVDRLFDAGAIQILVATHNMVWGMPHRAHLGIIMGTQYYEGKEHRYADYPIADLLQMIGRIGRQSLDAEGAKCVIFCHTPKKEFYKKFIYEPLPVESQLDRFLHDHVNAAVVNQVITTKQDAVDWITWTFFYRRLTQNPNYYNLAGTTPDHLSDHLSELIEDVVNDLQQSKCIAVVDGMHLDPLNLGTIASFYYLRYTTMELFSFSLTDKTKVRGLIDILSNATEFEEIPIRHKEPKLLEQMSRHCPIKIAKPEYNKPSTKAHILIQYHFQRRPVPGDLLSDQKAVLLRAPTLLYAMVDVIASNGWLSPAIAALELCQMLVQAVFEQSSGDLRQLPYFDDERIKHLKSLAPNVSTIFDFMDMDGSARSKLLTGLTKAQQIAISKVCDRYPDMELGHRLLISEAPAAGDDVAVEVKLERSWEEDDLPAVHAPHYPSTKQESWWLLVGDPKNNSLLGIKRVPHFIKSTKTKFEFQAPPAGEHALHLYFVTDSWLGCDQDVDFELTTVEPAESQDGDDDAMQD
jgi:pre-mRNA-splicing helicase BRR2